jgi:plasmid stabilization system protein ParE
LIPHPSTPEWRRERSNGTAFKKFHRNKRTEHPLSPKSQEDAMPRGDKSKYTDKQKRKAAHIAEGYKDRGVSKDEAESRAWATVNKDDGGGNKSGSGRGKHTSHPAAHRGGRKGGEASAARPAAERSAPARKAAKTRKKRAHAH